MIPTAIEKPFTRPGWTWELKWDGWRALAYAEGGRVRLVSRNGRDLTKRFRSLAEALDDVVADVVLDGEICVLDELGRSHFDAVGAADAPATFVAFDVLAQAGEILTDRSLADRRLVLARLLPTDVAALHRSPVLGEDGVTLWQWVQDVGHEGLVAKRSESRYRPGRTRDWLKIKTLAGRQAQRDRSERFAR